MFFFLALAALADGYLGHREGYTTQPYIAIYIAVGIAMVVIGGGFLLLRHTNPSAFGGHLVLAVEVGELLSFAAFWTVQTIERWHYTV